MILGRKTTVLKENPEDWDENDWKKKTTLHQELQRFGLEEISKGIFHKLRERHVMKHKSSKKTIKVGEGNGKRGRRAKRYLGDWWNEWSVCKKTPPPH